MIQGLSSLCTQIFGSLPLHHRIRVVSEPQNRKSRGVETGDVPTSRVSHRGEKGSLCRSHENLMFETDGGRVRDIEEH